MKDLESNGIVMTWAFRNTEDFLLTFAQGLWPMYCSRYNNFLYNIIMYLMDRNAAVHFGLIGICTYGMIGNVKAMVVLADLLGYLQGIILFTS